MKQLATLIVLIIAIAASVRLHAQEPGELLEYRFRSDSMIEALEDNLAKHVAVYPLSAPKLEDSECFKVDRNTKDKTKDKRERLTIVCASESTIYERVNTAYWLTLNAHSLNDLAMRVEATTSVSCSVKKCTNNIHYGQTPCANKFISPYGILCVHTLFPNVQHVCVEM
jgi:hypothetical protein